MIYSEKTALEVLEQVNCCDVKGFVSQCFSRMAILHGSFSIHEVMGRNVVDELVRQQLEIKKLKTELASTKEALESIKSAHADWSNRYIWLMHEVCDALGIDRDNTPAVDMVLCVKSLMQRDAGLINTELLAVLKAMVAEYGEFYGDTPEVAAQSQSTLIKSALQAIAKAEETGGE